MSIPMRVLAIAAGLFGAVAIALAAAGAHGGRAEQLQPAAFLLGTTAPALLIVALKGQGRLLAIGAMILALGAALFAADMAARAFIGNRLFPSAAPIGGVLAMAGWVMIGVGASRRR